MNPNKSKALADFIIFCLDGDTTPLTSEKLTDLIADFEQIVAMEDWFGINNN